MPHLQKHITGWGLLICLFIYQPTHAQSADPQVVAVAGASSQAIPGYTIDFTIGESVITTAAGNEVSFTQGFNQPLRADDYPTVDLNLTGTAFSNYIQLNWTTSSETNNAWFYIERSGDGIGFQIIDSVPTQAINGTSTTPLSYIYGDLQPLEGNNYYRIRQVGMNGSIRYSTTIMVAFSGNSWRVQVYPNPVHNTLHLKLYTQQATRAKVFITSITGQTMLYKFINLPQGYSDQTIEVGRLAQGAYILSVRELFTNRRMNVKVIKD